LRYRFHTKTKEKSILLEMQQGQFIGPWLERRKLEEEEKWEGEKEVDEATK